MADFTLMRNNSETYNGVSHPVTLIAKQHEDDVNQLI